MATATQNPRQAAEAARQGEVDQAAALLETLLKEKPYVSGGAIATALTGEHIDRIRDLLPDKFKADADRFVKRGILYFSRKPELEECTIASKIKCILDAAELGLALDGRLCHAVAYNCKYKDERGAERWRKEVQCQPDYKGLVVVAKRCGQIVDCYADVVCANDHFKHGRKDATHTLEHTYEVGEDRGDVKAAYAVVRLPGGDWRYELMSLADLDSIQSRSKAQNFGPWKTDTNEMRKKTVIRRILKAYTDDPGIAKAIELDEREFGTDDGAWIPPAGKVRVSDLNRQVAGDNGSTPAPEPNGSVHEPDPEPPVPTGEESQEPPPEAPLSDQAHVMLARINDAEGDFDRLVNLTQDLVASYGSKPRCTSEEGKRLYARLDELTASAKPKKR